MLKRWRDMQIWKSNFPHIKTDGNLLKLIFPWRKGDEGMKVGPHKFSQINIYLCVCVCVICGSTATCWAGRRRTAVRTGQLLYSSVQCCASQEPLAGDSSSSPTQVDRNRWTGRNRQWRNKRGTQAHLSGVEPFSLPTCLLRTINSTAAPPSSSRLQFSMALNTDRRNDR